MPLPEAEGIDQAPHPKSARALWFPPLRGYTIFAQIIIPDDEMDGFSLKFCLFCVEENMRNFCHISSTKWVF
jgi:hypothetical protein